MDQPQEIKAVLFDLGNTLIFFDADDRLDQVLQQADQALFTRLRELGYLIDSDFLQDFRRRMNLYYEEREVEFIEYTTRYVLRNLLEEKGMLVNEASLMDGLHAYHHVTQSHWQLDEATPATLQKLTQAGYRLGLISNASDDADVHNLVDQSYLRPFFQVILTSAAQGIRKPNPLIFWKALEALDVQPEQAVMVGDTLGADILGAKNAGVLSIWITQQADTPQNRAHRNTIIPDFTIENIRQLTGLLERFASPSG